LNKETELYEKNPTKNLLMGPITVMQNIREYNYLLSNFIKRDLRLKYRNSFLGYFWSLLEPLLLSAVYYVLFIIIADNPEKEYPLWVILGVITWSFFSRSLTGCISSLTKNSAMIKQIYFPRELFSINVVGSHLVITILSLFVAVPFMYHFGISPTIYLLMIPIGLFLASSLALGIGLLLAPLNVVNRDIEHLFRFITRAGFFLSPVMWTIDMIPASRASVMEYLLLNPMVVPITMVRNGIEGEALTIDLFYIIYSFAFCFCSLLLGTTVFKRFESEVIKKL
tara:strand:+ start:808 stop:1653 length:846 start_codon:yes stop_codon:yes gene_type:complete